MGRKPKGKKAAVAEANDVEQEETSSAAFNESSTPATAADAEDHPPPVTTEAAEAAATAVAEAAEAATTEAATAEPATTEAAASEAATTGAAEITSTEATNPPAPEAIPETTTAEVQVEIKDAAAVGVAAPVCAETNPTVPDKTVHDVDTIDEPKPSKPSAAAQEMKTVQPSAAPDAPKTSHAPPRESTGSAVPPRSQEPAMRESTPLVQQQRSDTESKTNKQGCPCSVM